MSTPAAALLPAPLIVSGHIVTFDPARPEIPDGRLYIDDSGLIQAVLGAQEPRPTGFDRATQVAAGGLVLPGLIDLHNHAYNCLPLWTSPTRRTPWTNRADWPKDPDYETKIRLPVNALCQADGKAVLKYVETKAAVGGVTAIQGTSKLGRPFDGFMVRNIEFETFGGTLVGSVDQSVLPLDSDAKYQNVERDLGDGHAFLYHLAEGTDPKLIDDYDGVRDHNCLAPGFIGIHSTALGPSQFDEWHSRARDGAIVWSPFSNLWLYGATTDVLAARAAGLTVCLGADWSPSGSKSVLGELKVADLYNTTRLGKALSDEDICAMVTRNPAQALGWQERIGSLRAGLRGDFIVIADKAKDPYRGLIESTEADVDLVAINGYSIYGTPDLMTAAAAVNPEPIQVSPTIRRAITLRDPRIPSADMGWPDVLAGLEAVRANPVAAKRDALLREGAEIQPVALVPDKPWDSPIEHPDVLDSLAQAEVPPPDALTPDAAYFAAIAAATFHNGLLDGLGAYYGL